MAKGTQMIPLTKELAWLGSTLLRSLFRAGESGDVHALRKVADRFNRLATFHAQPSCCAGLTFYKSRIKTGDGQNKSTSEAGLASFVPGFYH